MDEVKKQSEGFVQYFSGLSRKTLPEVMAECRAFNPSWQEAEIKPWAESKLQFDLSLFSVITMNPSLYKEFVPRIKCPTLLIIAEKGINPVETAENAARLWKSKQPFKWVQIKGATHNIRRDNFPAFRQAVFSFLESLPA
jgi:pimeloyl-ACP methyl ester carboxylesterase